MVTDRVRIDSLAAGQQHLAQVSGTSASVLVVPVARAVPAWLGELVRAVEGADATVVVEAAARTDLDDESRAGWEIGVCTAALAAGAADVVGIDPKRVARVREITGCLAAARPDPVPEDAS